MRIKTRVRASAAFAVAIAITVAAVLGVGLNTVQSAIARGAALTDALNEIFQLSMLTTDYLVNHEPRAARQWEGAHARIEESLHRLEVRSDEDVALLARMETELHDAEFTFTEIVAAHEAGLSDDVRPEVSAEYQSRLASRLLVLMQSLVTDTATLSAHAGAEASEAQRVTNVAVLAISVVGILVMVVIGLSADRALLAPLEALQDTAARVGRGNLGARSGITSADEVGGFARVFDGMVADLERSYARLEDEIAERRRAEQALGEYRDQLEHLVDERTAELVAVNEDLVRATRAKDDFLAAMSHELRTPLNSIIGFSDLMLKGLAGELNAEQERQLTMVHSSGKQLLALVNEVLELSRISAGHLNIVARPFSPSGHVRRLIEMMEPLAAERGLTLGWSCASDVPAEVVCDPGKFDQVMLNLLSNAIKFTNEGGVDVAIRMADDGMVAFHVTDTGIGVPEEDQEAIFEHFRQLDHGESASQLGTGLGLAISRRLAEALGGTLHVRSAVGKGSTFTLTIACAPAS